MPSGDGRGERGYTLVALVVIVTVLTIMVAAALPLWSARLTRDREEELISRGFQYAEALRVFQTRFGRLPNRLEELIEVEPRSIRQLWKDPMTGEGYWAVVVEVPGGGLIAVNSRTGQPLLPQDADGDGRPDPLPPPQEPPPGGGTVATGPIHGVRSMASGEAYLTLFDSTDYADWEFTIERLQTSIAKPGQSGLPPRSSALWIGRPFRYPLPGSVKNPPQEPPGRPGAPGSGGGGGKTGTGRPGAGRG
ncbi:MAG TPA: type II secretion system protein [Thermoanaerobaculia bacterium]|nr:type II secretion system protein [Thermoanaerobaculia bacterium]